MNGSLRSIPVQDFIVSRLFLYMKRCLMFGTSRETSFITVVHCGRGLTQTIFEPWCRLLRMRIVDLSMASYSESCKEPLCCKCHEGVSGSGSCITRVPGTDSNIWHNIVPPQRPVFDIHINGTVGSPILSANSTKSATGILITLLA